MENWLKQENYHIKKALYLIQFLLHTCVISVGDTSPGTPYYMYMYIYYLFYLLSTLFVNITMYRNKYNIYWNKSNGHGSRSQAESVKLDWLPLLFY